MWHEFFCFSNARSCLWSVSYQCTLENNKHTWMSTCTVVVCLCVCTQSLSASSCVCISFVFSCSEATTCLICWTHDTPRKLMSRLLSVMLSAIWDGTQTCQHTHTHTQYGKYPAVTNAQGTFFLGSSYYFSALILLLRLFKTVTTIFPIKLISESL